MVGKKRCPESINGLTLRTTHAPNFLHAEQPPPKALLELLVWLQLERAALIAIQIVAVITLRENRLVVIACASDFGYAAHW